ncbi:MAG: hypothetical protein NC548_52845 [Lachnospiraceae bacterium]|nr:hypothetical protein [Lachnospiraceae bacterium]
MADGIEQLYKKVLLRLSSVLKLGGLNSTKMIGDSTCIGCLYPAVIGRLYSNIGVGLLLYLWNGYAKTLERDKADTIPTPFLCLIIDVS